MNGQGGARGIVFTQGERLILESVAVSGLPIRGPVVQGNGLRAAVSRSRFENIGGVAASIEDGAYAAFDNSVFVGTSDYAIRFIENSAIQAEEYGLTAEGGGSTADNAHLLANGNTVTGAAAYGLVGFSGGTIIASGNAVTDSTTGMLKLGFGELWTLQNNTIEKNATDVSGATPKVVR